MSGRGTPPTRERKTTPSTCARLETSSSSSLPSPQSPFTSATASWKHAVCLHSTTDPLAKIKYFSRRLDPANTTILLFQAAICFCFSPNINFPARGHKSTTSGLVPPNRIDSKDSTRCGPPEAYCTRTLRTYGTRTSCSPVRHIFTKPVSANLA